MGEKKDWEGKWFHFHLYKPTRPVFISVTWERLGETSNITLPWIAFNGRVLLKVVASIACNHLQLEEQLWLTETHCRFGRGMVVFLPPTPKVWCLRVNSEADIERKLAERTFHRHLGVHSRGVSSTDTWPRWQLQFLLKNPQIQTQNRSILTHLCDNTFPSSCSKNACLCVNKF